MINNPGTRSATPTGAQRNYMRNMMTNITNDYERRRKLDEITETEPDNAEIPPLQVKVYDFYVATNAKTHHTDQFELVQDNTPIFRRGHSFYMTLRTDRPYQARDDTIKIIFDYGPSPSVTKGTKAILNVIMKDGFNYKSSQWDGRIHSTTGDDISLEIQTPATCQVGIWHCTVQTEQKSNPQVNNLLKIDDDIYILFNPWCKDDSVYMYHENEKKEYILNDTGKVWMGSYRQPKGRRWIFGQFDDCVLPTIMYLMEISGLPHSERGSSIHVARAISAVINSADEDGLIVGRWDGDYKDGTSPFAWTGSVAIMEEYLTSGGMPVRYGQCWIFSAVTVTVCRALGIPCRTVTNYVSAHDTNASLTVDKYFDKSGNEITGGPDGECYDSCWNFHVWNDVWMARPDLPQGYGGWQIIDSTPQEESDSMFRCGPASVEAVKQGKVGFLYDTPFVFAEVNADVCHFQEDDKSDWGFSRLRINNYHVGRKIVTKRIDRDDDVGDADMWDVTNFYKNPEGSQDERLAVFNAVRGVDRAQQYYNFPEKHEEDVYFDLVDIDEVQFGQPFNILVHIQNKSNKIRTIEAVISASSVYYTGVTVHRLKRACGQFKMQPGTKETLRVTVTVNEYVDKLVDHSLIKIYAIANVKETLQTWSEEDDFPLIKPKIATKITGPLIVGEKCKAMFSFWNPLQKKLTGCTISVEGPGLQRPKKINFRDVEPNEMAVYTEYFQPKKPGERKIMASFNSNELTEVSGSTTVQIQP